jgi:ABC-type phosphate/phosphonate transport system substrate-binding protein
MAMLLRISSPCLFRLGFVLAALLTIPVARTHGQTARLDVLHIGATGTLTGDAESRKEKSGLETLRRFIKDETGLTNDIVGQKSWREVAGQMARGYYHIGVFQGYEFAWAQEKYPELRPLALGVNSDRYPSACLVVRRDNPARDFAGLRGQSLAVPTSNQGFLRLFVDRQCESIGKKGDPFFSKSTTPDNVEDALDDVVDGKVQAALLDRTSLEAYQRRKPGRFNRLKEVARSQPFPPLVVACYGSTLDQSTLQRFRNGLLNATRKDRGEMLLTLSRLTGFEVVPEDFRQRLAETRKTYPPDEGRGE